nr:SUMF1/EgtB/PvdO family nonheme iron enzyme [Entomohabitans teleogrylli]
MFSRFFMGQFEVTQADWLAVMGEKPYVRDRSNPYYLLPGMTERITHPDHPATVSWQDAMKFIEKLNQREGTTGYRLLTEAEWEYAARAGSTTRYFFGDDASALDNYAWYGENFVSGGTHPVGMKKPNPWGLYDIYGNAWEWVSDYYSTRYYLKAQNTIRKARWWYRTCRAWRQLA